LALMTALGVPFYSALPDAAILATDSERIQIWATLGDRTVRPRQLVGSTSESVPHPGAQAAVRSLDLAQCALQR
jgi:hypothetical protein